ncbi:MAG: hypothetical protein U1F27_14925 [Turneriella sp.]
MPESSRTVILADLSLSPSRRQSAISSRRRQITDKLSNHTLVALIAFFTVSVYRELNFTWHRELLRRKIHAMGYTGNRTMLYDAISKRTKCSRQLTARQSCCLPTAAECLGVSRIADPVDLYTAHPVPLFVAGKHLQAHEGESLCAVRLVRLARISVAMLSAHRMHRISVRFSIT